MGLDVSVGDEYIGKVGSYGWCGAFLVEIGDKLEGGDSGSRYPFIQTNLPLSGEHTPEEAGRLLKELIEIKRGLKRTSYPTLMALKNGRLIRQRESYGHDTFMSGWSVSLGVCPDGVFFELYQIEGEKKLELPTDGIRQRYTGDKPYIGYFTSIKNAGRHYVGTYQDGRTRIIEYELERVLRWFSNRADEYVVGQVNSAKVFGHVTRVLQKACRTSIKTKKPIIYC